VERFDEPESGLEQTALEQTRLERFMAGEPLEAQIVKRRCGGTT
jgi:hypothetical protein